MAGGLAALLDDVAVIAKMASAAGTKAVGVVVDDAAVTPQYVRGFSPARELPIIWKIARGSLVNKAILIVLLLLLDHFLPFVLTPLLMLGGLYLSYEGAEKLYEALFHRKDDAASEAVAPVPATADPEMEKKMVKGAITTDFILSAEIMVISLNTVNVSGGATMPLVDKTIVLVAVALLITLLVYGVVALIVKMDDVGLHMAKRDNEGSQRIGRSLVKAMPVVLSILSTVGIAAMLWVGGHILLDGAYKLGLKAPYDLVHHLEAPAHHVAGVGGFLGWLVNTLCSAVVGLVIGGIAVAIMHVLPFKKKDHAAAH
ncbi:DUF808 domain-containing protein [Mariniluteicoccus endophyticus]